MNIYKKYRWLIIIVTLTGLVGAVVFTYFKPAYFDTSISFSINRTSMQTTEDYQFDGYYAIQASDLFSQTVMSWFLTPSVLLEIYEQAEIDPQINSIESFTSRFKTRKYSPQNIVVRYKEHDFNSADNIAQAIIKIIEEKGSTANQTADQKSFFEVVGAKPVIVEKTSTLWLNAIIGLISGLILSIVVSYFIEYWKADSRRNQI